jgi:hypothetical protein
VIQAKLAVGGSHGTAMVRQSPCRDAARELSTVAQLSQGAVYTRAIVPWGFADRRA